MIHTMQIAGIDKDLHERFKKGCNKEGHSIRGVITYMMMAYLEEDTTDVSMEPCKTGKKQGIEA